MVRRLIEKKDIRVSEKSLCKKNTDLKVILYLRHLLLMKILRNPEAIEHLSSSCLSFPSAELCKLALKLSSPYSILFGEIRFLIDRIALLHDIIELLESHDDSINYTIFIECEVILAENCHSLTRCDDDLTCIRLNLP